MRASTEGFEVLLRLHVTRDNQEAAGQLLVELAREFGGDPRFTFILKAIRRFGGQYDLQLPVFVAGEGDSGAARSRRAGGGAGLQRPAGRFRTAGYVARLLRRHAGFLRGALDRGSCQVHRSLRPSQ